MSEDEKSHHEVLHRILAEREDEKIGKGWYQRGIWAGILLISFPLLIWGISNHEEGLNILCAILTSLSLINLHAGAVYNERAFPLKRFRHKLVHGIGVSVILIGGALSLWLGSAGWGNMAAILGLVAVIGYMFFDFNSGGITND